MKHVATVLCLLVLGFALWSANADRSSSAAQSGPPIPLKELRERGIEGTLGQPLGTVVEVSGKVVANTSNAKADVSEPFFLRIDDVDGQALATPKRFSSTAMRLIEWSPELKVGDSFRCIGYESGGFEGTPGNVFKHVEPWATSGFHFVFRFVVVKVNAASTRVREMPQGPASEETSDVQGQDLGKRLRVIGSLRLPLGERVRIRGEWYKPTSDLPLKDPSLRLRVTEVNGTRLEQEVVFHAWFVVPAPRSQRIEPRPGEAWEAEGFEEGGFMGLPAWAYHAIWGEQGPATPYGFGFVMRFCYITASTEKESANSK